MSSAVNGTNALWVTRRKGFVPESLIVKGRQL